ncbi:MAG TPA: hypothetical protein VMH20_03440 [Verrucomicrobiae bacterium]|nr:hypothetical protein [Verrucomicrobiae bacterium]
MKKIIQPRTKKRSSNPHACPKFPVISEQMKEWSAMLQGELHSWPAITTKSMFGFLFFYRRGVVFAALPRTRGFDSPSSLVFKLPPLTPALRKRVEGDARIGVSHKATSKGWFSFELRSESDLRDALFWLHHAYEAARN